MSTSEVPVRARSWGRAGSAATRELAGGGSLRAVVLPLGRVATVLFSAGILVRPVADRVQAVALVTAIMSVCLQQAFSTAHPLLGQLVPTLTGALGGLIAAATVALLLPSSGIELTALLATTLCICVLLPLVERLLRLHVVGRRRVLILGSEESAASLRRELGTTDAFRIVGIGSPADRAEIMRACKPDIIVEASAPSPNEPGDTRLVSLAHFHEHALGRVLPNGRAPERLTAVTHRSGSAARFSKRAFDVVVALLGFLVTAPLWPVLAVLVRQTEGGLFHRQLRVGEGGRPFTMYKFRTMRLDAEPFGQARWAEASDPRVTHPGRVLRQTHLDELPQLWNVLRGDMSIVGPRPERPELSPMLEEAIPNWNCRLAAKPGLTGWAQVSLGYASDCDMSEKKLSYDLWYLEHQSLMVDAAICLRTLPTLLPTSPAPVCDSY